MVFAELMHLCKLRSFRYLPLGLRDGLLAQMMADYNASTAIKEQVQSERHDALLSAAKHYGADLTFAQRIRDLALELFRRCSPCINCRPNMRTGWKPPRCCMRWGLTSTALDAGDTRIT